MGPHQFDDDALDVVRRYLFEALERRDALEAASQLARSLRVAAGLITIAAGTVAWVVSYSPPPPTRSASTLRLA